MTSTSPSYIPSRLYNYIWLFNLFFMCLSLAAMSRQFGLSFIPGLLTGAAFSAILYYLRIKAGKESSYHYSFIVNIAVLFVGILLASFSLWNDLLSNKPLNIVEHTVILFFLLGLSSIGALLKMISTSYAVAPSVEKRIREIMGGPSLLLSFCVAVITACMTMLVFHTLANSNYFGILNTKFLQRGIIPPLCLVLFYWEVILLLGKYQLSINNLSIKSFKVASNPKKTTQSPLIDTWQDYYSSFPATKKKPLETIAAKFVDLAWQANETFYYFPRYINWAIPILGFIGTVLGISLAAGEIGNIVDSSNLNIGDSINSAMKPLGIAFDTTLIALSLSVFLAFTYTVLQRWEEQRFLFIEEYINRIK